MRIFLLVFLVCINLLNGSMLKEYIPKNFYANSELLAEEVRKQYSIVFNKPGTFNDLFYISYFASLAEHESCLHLKHSRCWNPKSQFKTKWKNGLRREQGAGIGMITRAWRSTGKLRFDTLRNLKRRYPKQLKELNWDNITERVDLQIRAMLLLHRDNYLRLEKRVGYPYEILAMSDSAYNGGIGYIYKDRKKCGLKSNCNPDIWFYNVEKMNSRGNRILYGKRTANMINRDHVKDVLKHRFVKYYLWYLENDK